MIKSHMQTRMILPIICILLLSLTTISAVSYNLGPKVEVFNTQLKLLDLNNIDKQEDLMFKVTLINEQNYWLCSQQLFVVLTITKEGLNEKILNLQWNPGLNNKQEFCLAPNKEFETWLFFEDYNKLEEDDRIGDWTINPTIYVSNPISRPANDISKGTSAEVDTKGNLVKIYVGKETPSTHPTFDNWKKNFDKFWLYWILGIGGGIVIIISIITFFVNKK